MLKVEVTRCPEKLRTKRVIPCLVKTFNNKTKGLLKEQKR